MNIIIVLLVVIGLFYLLTEIIGRQVYGPLLSDNNLDKIKSLSDRAYHASDNTLYLDIPGYCNYIAHQPGIPIISKWSVVQNGGAIGRIPIWSKMSKYLDNKYNTLRKEELKKNGWNI